MAHSIEVRRSLGLRDDQAWVESVISDPTSVQWTDILVTPDELAILVDRHVRDVIAMRLGVGLPADEVTVRQLLADPTTVYRGTIPMTPGEAAAWDDRVDNQAETGPTIQAYGQRFPAEWAGLYYEVDGAAVALFTGHLGQHEAAIEALFVPDTVRYTVRAAKWSLAELEAVNNRLRQDWFDARKIRWLGGGIRVRENAVVIDVETPERRPGIEQEIAEGLDAVGLLLVRAVVVPAWQGGYGSVSITIVDQAGRPVPEVDCVLSRMNATAPLTDWAYMTSDENGVCHAERLPATLYSLRITRGFQGPLLTGGEVDIPKEGDARLTVRVTIP